MRRIFPSALVLGAMWGLLLPASISAQAPISPAELPEQPPPAPISEGEPGRHTSTLSGELVGPDGEPISRARVLVRGGGRTLGTATDAQGRFDFTDLPVGQYELIASHPGFGSVTRQVEVSAARQFFVTVKIPPGVIFGPVPPGEPSQTPQPDRPTASPPTLFVVEKRLVDDLALQAALNAETESGGELVAIVPLDEGASLFIYERHSDPAPCTVIVDTGAGRALGAERLETRIRQQSNKTFVGVHRLASGVPALVFRDGR